VRTPEPEVGLARSRGSACDNVSNRRSCNYPGWEARESARYRAGVAADTAMKLPADSG